MNVCFHGRSVFKYVGNLFPLLMTEKFRRCPSDHFFSLSVARVTPLHDKALTAPFPGSVSKRGWCYEAKNMTSFFSF